MKMTDGILIKKVASFKDGRKKYQIRAVNGGYACSCLAYRFAFGEIGKKDPCKHMRQANLV